MQWALLLCCIFLASHFLVVTNGMECHTCFSTKAIPGVSKTATAGDGGDDGGGGSPPPARAEAAPAGPPVSTGSCPDPKAKKAEKWAKVKDQFIEECDVGVTACIKEVGKKAVDGSMVEVIHYGCVSDEEIKANNLKKDVCDKEAKSKATDDGGKEHNEKREVCVCTDVINCNKSSKTSKAWIGLLVVVTIFNMIVAT